MDGPRQDDCTPSGISTSQLRSTFLFEFRLKIVRMWITRVWNPLSEFPYFLQVLQEKVRQNVIWGYWRWTGNSPSPFYLVTGEVSPGTPPVGFASEVWNLSFFSRLIIRQLKKYWFRTLYEKKGFGTGYVVTIYR